MATNKKSTAKPKTSVSSTKKDASASKGKSARKTSAKPSSKKSAPTEEPIPRSKVVKFVISMLLIFLAIFLIVSFTSFVFNDHDIVHAINEKGELTGEPVHNICGKLGLKASYFFIYKTFGLASFFVPVFIFIFALWLIDSIRLRMFKFFVKTAILMIWAHFVLAWLPDMFRISDCWSMGGRIGENLYSSLYSVVGQIGVFILVVLTTLLVLIYFSWLTIENITNSIKRLKKAKELAARLAHRKNTENEQTDEKEDEEEEKEEGEETSFVDPEKSKTLVYDAEGNLVGEQNELEEEAETQSVSNVDTTQIVLDINDVEGGQKKEETDESIEENDDHEENEEESVEGNDPQFTIETPVETEKGDGNIERGDILTPYDPKLALENYKYPTLDLLDKKEDGNLNVDKAEQEANKNRIIHVLKTFGVEIQRIAATIGPTITLYEITPAEGTRINRIRNLEDDIALSLAAEGIRIIAPIPGKGTIGIEVPNKNKRIVSMESVLNSKTFQESKMELPCAMGKTITNEVFMVDLAKAPHMLVAGATGQGKSVGLNAIITSLLYKKHPSELKMVMVDPKKVEFSVYSPIANQFLAKLEDEEEAIITDNQRVVKTLNALCKLMDDRYMLLKRASVRNIKEYNEKFKERKLNPLEGHDYMPYYVVIIDEFGDLIMTAGKEIELPICRIAQLARAVGIHMIIATQRPTTRIITGTIKANFPARVAFKVSAMMDSRIILDRPGANQLIGRGDMLYLQSADPVRVQCAFVDTPEVNRICEFISQQQKFPEMTYLPEPPMEEGESSSKEVDMQNLDSLFGDAAKMIVSQQQGSTSLIQRKFSIGFNRAGRLMDQLEKAGVVGPQIGAKPREVLIQDLLTLDGLLNSLGVN